MSGNDAKVLLDLNSPSFLDDLFDLDAPEVKKAQDVKEAQGPYLERGFSRPRPELGRS